MFTPTGRGGGEDRRAARPRVGLFGRLGAGNIGNDATLEAVLAYLRAQQPDAVLDCMCSGPDEVTGRFGIAATPLHWFHEGPRTTSGVARLALNRTQIVLGVLVDAWRTASWVRGHDVVIVPGMGVLESTLPQRPWQLPYSLFLLSIAGRLLGAKVAFVSVGAAVPPERLTRWLLAAAARLAYYRSFRDESSRDAARRMGAFGVKDQVYPDLAFGLPTVCEYYDPSGTVAVGVMAYSGSGAERHLARQIQQEYVGSMKQLVRWLLDTDHRVRIFIGDAADDRVAREIMADAQTYRRGAYASSVRYEPATSVDDVTRQIETVETVIATRFHNVLVALKCDKPTLAIGYGKKHEALMGQLGVRSFLHDIRELDVERLKEQFCALEDRAEEIHRTLRERNLILRSRVDRQFAELSCELFPPGDRGSDVR